MVNCRRRGSQTHHLQFIRLIVALLVIPRQIEAIENSDDALAMQFVECAGNLRWSPGLGWI